MNYWGQLNAALRQLGFTNFSLGSVQGPELAALQPAVSAVEEHLVALRTEPSWAAIAAQLRNMAGPIQTLSVQQQGHDLYLALGRIPSTLDAEAEHQFIDAAGQWFKVIREQGGSVTLSEESKGLAQQAVAAIGINPVLAAGASLALSMAEFRGHVYVLIVDVVQELSDVATWQNADLTFRRDGVWSQIWIWQLANGTVIRGGHGPGERSDGVTIDLPPFGDRPEDKWVDFATPFLNDPAQLEGTLRAFAANYA